MISTGEAPAFGLSPVTAGDSIIGRDRERTALAQFVDALAQEPVAVLLDGEPGIGKSTLWDDAVSNARSRSYRVLSCRPVRSEAPFSFAGLSDLLEGVMEEALPALPTPQRYALEVALLLTEASGSGPDRRAVSTAVLSVLRSLAVACPLLVAVDDVHWLDRPTARVLEFAFRRLEHEHIGLLASIRTDDWDQDLTLATGLPGFATQHLTLGPMTMEEVGLLVRQRLGIWLPRPILGKVHETSRGNPLYALEIAQAIRGQGIKWSSGLTIPIPDDLRRLIRERVGQLSGEVRHVLLVVAALAQPTLAVVAKAVGDPATTASALMRAAEAKLVECSGDRIRFAHPLIGAVVYSDVPRDARRPVHRQLAAIVTDPEERARHLGLAAQGPDPVVATAMDAAARHAHSRGAPEAAAELAEKALALTPAAGEQYTERLLQVAEYHFAAGDTVRTREHLERAVTWAPGGHMRGIALLRLGTLRACTEQVQEAADMLEEGLAQVKDDPRLSAEVHLTLAAVLGSLAAVSAMTTHAGEALLLAERTEEPGLISRALAKVTHAAFLRDEAPEGAVTQSTFERALALEKPDHTPADELASATFGVLLMWSEDLDGARKLLSAAHRRAVEGGDEGSLATLLRHMSELECRAGNFEMAARYATEGDQVTIQCRHDARRVGCLYARALADAHLGEVEKACEEVERGEALAWSTGQGPIPGFPALLGFLELSQGRPHEADRHFAEARSSLAALGAQDIGINQFLPDEIEVLVAIGETERAGALLDTFQDRARTLRRPSALASASRCRGFLRDAQGDVPGAMEDLEESLRRLQRLNRPFELGRTLLVMGTVERRAKQKRAARRSLEQALRTFERLGAALWAARARDELRRIGGRVARPWDLTATEQKIGELAAEGHTNKEIAEVLFLSIRTVEGSLSKSYQKLGVRSRTELARKISPPQSPNERIGSGRGI